MDNLSNEPVRDTLDRFSAYYTLKQKIQILKQQQAALAWICAFSPEFNNPNKNIHFNITSGERA